MSESSFQVLQIDHVEFIVPDQYAAAAWYRHVLGLEIVREFEHWATDGPLMISSDGGRTMLALFAGEVRSEQKPTGFRRVAFRVDGARFMLFLDRLPMSDVRANDGQLLQAEQVVDHDQSWSIYFSDPYGYRLEITTYDHEIVRRRLTDSSS